VGEFVRDYLIENAVVNDVPESSFEYQEARWSTITRTTPTSYGMRLEDFLASYAGVATVDELLLSTSSRPGSPRPSTPDHASYR
jgi:hypothetical protein